MHILKFGEQVLVRVDTLEELKHSSALNALSSMKSTL